MNFKLRTMNNEKGFILALSVLLVLVLGISGTGFMQLDYLERRMAMNEVDNHGGFYLANAGIERARETFKIDTAGTPTWTPILNLTPPYNTLYTLDDGSSSPHFASLCPVTPCVIPIFGAEVNSSSVPPLPFDATFDDGHYEVRAFNDASGPPLFGPAGETATIDLNGILIFRAFGHVRGEQKLLEAKVQAVSGLDLINCQGGTGQPCPERLDGGPTVDAADGRDPASHSTLPSLKLPLADPANFYRFDNFPSNFTTYSPGPALTPDYCAPIGSIDCSNPNNIQLDVVNDSFYFVNTPNATIHIKSSGPLNRSRVVVYALGGAGGNVLMEGNHQYTDMIIIGQGTKPNGIQLKDGTIRAPLPMPVVIAEGDVLSGNANVTVYGTIYATKTPIPSGLVNVNPVQVHGVVIGDRVQIQGSSTYSDDHQTDPAFLKYYAIMPGFDYPDELKTTVVVAGGWQEIE